MEFLLEKKYLCEKCNLEKPLYLFLHYDIAFGCRVCNKENYSKLCQNRQEKHYRKSGLPLFIKDKRNRIRSGEVKIGK